MTDYKTNIIKEIRAALAGDLSKCIKAMHIIHSYQVQNEYSSGNVLYRNDMGFTPGDAHFLTSLCNWDSRGRAFTPNQSAYIKKLMPKYARQLFDHYCSKGDIRHCANSSKYIANVPELLGEFVSPCPETAQAELPFDSADAAYEQERWRETMADDNNYFNFERYLADVSNF